MNRLFIFIFLVLAGMANEQDAPKKLKAGEEATTESG